VVSTAVTFPLLTLPWADAAFGDGDGDAHPAIVAAPKAQITNDLKIATEFMMFSFGAVNGESAPGIDTFPTQMSDFNGVAEFIANTRHCLIGTSCIEPDN
jgi:hypothetical protein